jgi:soluble lytic murein transglycosylase-like protein
MQQDRNPKDERRDDTEARDGAGRGEDGRTESAPQRRAGGSDAATRDYQETMQELDSSGTVEEAHDRKAGGSQEGEDPTPHRRAADAQVDENGMHASAAVTERRSSDSDIETPRSRKGMLRDNALTLGLAASSLALLAGARSTGGAGEAPGEAAMSAAFMPPAEVAADKGVSWDLHVSDHERVDFFVEFLMGRNYDKTRSWLERIGKYGPLIQNELRERGMPEDLLYLAMIESGLNPNAYSKAHAAGLWQFIEETGKRYGLEVSSYVDERRDPVKATVAGLTYLQYMHERFDSWYLSAAGYNTGENRVGRLMRETTGSEKGSDEGYWSIWERLPRETRDYVPLMLAMGHIAKEPDKYGFHDIVYEQPLQFEEVVVPGGTKLADIARVAGVGSDVIEDLNPHFVKKQTPPSRDMAVRVPVGQQQQVAAAFQPAASAQLAD